MTVPPRLEPKLFISSATDERSTDICDRFAGVSKAPSALNSSCLSMPGTVTLASSENLAESAAALVCATFVKLESSGTAAVEPPQPAARTASQGDESRDEGMGASHGHAGSMHRPWRGQAVIRQTGYRRSAAPPPIPPGSQPPARPAPART